VALLLLNTALTQGAFQEKNLARELKQLTGTQQALRLHLAAVQEPRALADRATQLGLVPSQCPVFLRLPAGDVLGTPCAARAVERPAASRKASGTPTSAVATGKTAAAKANASTAKAPAVKAPAVKSPTVKATTTVKAPTTVKGTATKGTATKGTVSTATTGKSAPAKAGGR
jgi:hypothetical protein